MFEVKTKKNAARVLHAWIVKNANILAFKSVALTTEGRNFLFTKSYNW
jgi:hypothetical protein